MDRLTFERKLKASTMSKLDRRLPCVKQAIRREIAAELASNAADFYANALADVKAQQFGKAKKKFCPDCGGNGYIVVKHDGEPDDYHDCQKCDCSGEIPS